MIENPEFIMADASFGHFAKKLEDMIAVEVKKGEMLKWNEVVLKEAIDNEDAILVLVDEEIAGFVCLILHRRYVEICALIVAFGHRNKKIGTSLMEKAISLAKEKYSDKIIILLPNKISHHLGEKFDFTNVARSGFDDEVWNDCVFCSEHKKFPDCHCQPMMLMP